MSLNHMHWTQAATHCQQNNTAYAVATIVGVSGSTPRGSGSKMVITEQDTFSSIGGGGLEHLIVLRARELLATDQDCQEIKQFPLGAKPKQCCGGSMTVLLECFTPAKPHIVIFGAGHVCKALVTVLKQLPVNIRLIDSRADMLNEYHDDSDIDTVLSEDPRTQCDLIPDHALVLVMTHDHQLDYDLSLKLLEDWRFGFLGLIGSDTKARRFGMRLRNEGLSEDQMNKLQCPMGHPDLKGKLPMEIAISVSAKLLMVCQQLNLYSPTHSQSWKAMKESLPQPALQTPEKYG